MTPPRDYLPVPPETITADSTAIELDTSAPPEVKLLSALVRHAGDDPGELLKDRYLCRGGGLLLVGPTGVGKSSFSMQAMICWALGRPFFGIQPVNPLKSLLVQAENDEGDLAEMRDGAMAGMNLTDDERKPAMENVLVAREDTRTGNQFFLEVVRPLLEQNRPDLLWVDPALAFLGGESSSQKDVGQFLRNSLNPLLREFNLGVIVIHHTNKPLSGKEQNSWSAGDFAYLGGGSAEWANWSRAVLAIRSLGDHAVFELRAGKRGGRLGWKEADGQTKAFAKLIAHSNEPGAICWREADASEAPPQNQSKAKTVPTPEDVLAHVPRDKPISKVMLQRKANAAGIAVNRINPLISELIGQGILFESTEKRPGTNPLQLLSRTPQR